MLCTALAGMVSIANYNPDIITLHGNDPLERKNTLVDSENSGDWLSRAVGLLVGGGSARGAEAKEYNRETVTIKGKGFYSMPADITAKVDAYQNETKSDLNLKLNREASASDSTVDTPEALMENPFKGTQYEYGFGALTNDPEAKIYKSLLTTKNLSFLYVENAKNLTLFYDGKPIRFFENVSEILFKEEYGKIISKPVIERDGFGNMSDFGKLHPDENGILRNPDGSKFAIKYYDKPNPNTVRKGEDEITPGNRSIGSSVRYSKGVLYFYNPLDKEIIPANLSEIEILNQYGVSSVKELKKFIYSLL